MIPDVNLPLKSSPTRETTRKNAAVTRKLNGRCSNNCRIKDRPGAIQRAIRMMTSESAPHVNHHTIAPRSAPRYESAAPPMPVWLKKIRVEKKRLVTIQQPNQSNNFRVRLRKVEAPGLAEILDHHNVAAATIHLAIEQGTTVRRNGQAWQVSLRP